MVFVGKRDGALAAAQRLGIEVVLVVERAPRRVPPGVRAVIETAGAPADRQAVARLIRALGELEGVIALTEGAVLAAAQLRRELGAPGLTPEQALRCTDKAVMKRAAAAAGLRCAPFVHADQGLTGPQIVARLALPLWLKPARGSGGRGARRVDAPGEVPAELPGGSMAEACVRGVEMSVESLVSDGVPVFVNVTEYYEPRWANLLPARLPEAQRAALLDLNLCAIRALGVGRGITHLEVFLTAEGFVFGELAARPPGGHLMELIELAYGFDPWACCLELERGRSVRAAQLAQRAAGVRVLHPGAGRVVAVNGLEAIARLPQLVRLVCRARPGDLVAERAGAGQEVGYALFQSERREDVAAALEAARREISFAMAGA